MKLVISVDYGGFGLSFRATEKYLALKGKECYWFKTLPGSDNKWKPCEYPENELFASAFTTPDAQEGTYFSTSDIERDDTDLIKVVEEMGEAASGRYARLKIVEIPDDVAWEIEEYDGSEWVSEKHRTWR